jgi:hypothetical protein
MGLWDWLTGGAARRRKQAEAERAQRKAARRAREAGAKASREARNRRQAGTRPGGTVHLDAAFDDDEMSDFLLGLAVECRSTWIEQAQWNQQDSVLTLRLRRNGRDYRFPGIGYPEAVHFGQAYSKGHWYWSDWRGHIGVNSPFTLEPALEPGMAHRTGGY